MPIAELREILMTWKLSFRAHWVKGSHNWVAPEALTGFDKIWVVKNPVSEILVQ